MACLSTRGLSLYSWLFRTLSFSNIETYTASPHPKVLAKPDKLGQKKKIYQMQLWLNKAQGAITSYIDVSRHPIKTAIHKITIYVVQMGGLLHNKVKNKDRRSICKICKYDSKAFFAYIRLQEVKKPSRRYNTQVLVRKQKIYIGRFRTTFLKKFYTSYIQYMYIEIIFNSASTVVVDIWRSTDVPALGEKIKSGLLMALMV